MFARAADGWWYRGTATARDPHGQMQVRVSFYYEPFNCVAGPDAGGCGRVRDDIDLVRASTPAGNVDRFP